MSERIRWGETVTTAPEAHTIRLYRDWQPGEERDTTPETLLRDILAAMEDRGVWLVEVLPRRRGVWRVDLDDADSLLQWVQRAGGIIY